MKFHVIRSDSRSQVQSHGRPRDGGGGGREGEMKGERQVMGEMKGEREVMGEMKGEGEVMGDMLCGDVGVGVNVIS